MHEFYLRTIHYSCPYIDEVERYLQGCQDKAPEPGRVLPHLEEIRAINAMLRKAAYLLLDENEHLAKLLNQHGIPFRMKGATDEPPACEGQDEDGWVVDPSCRGSQDQAVNEDDWFEEYYRFMEESMKAYAVR